MACASRMSWRKDSSAISARVGIRRLAMAAASASHVDRPVSSARRSRVSSVVLPMPRAGVLMTRLQRHGVVRIADEAEIAEQVFDLGALVKAESADHGVADVVAAQSFFDEAGLRVGAIEDGAVRHSFAFGRSTDSRRNF